MEEDLDALIDDLPAYDVIGSSGVVAPRIVSDCSLDGLQEEKIKLGEFVICVISTHIFAMILTAICSCLVFIS